MSPWEALNPHQIAVMPRWGHSELEPNFRSQLAEGRWAWYHAHTDASRLVRGERARSVRPTVPQSCPVPRRCLLCNQRHDLPLLGRLGPRNSRQRRRGHLRADEWCSQVARGECACPYQCDRPPQPGAPIYQLDGSGCEQRLVQRCVGDLTDQGALDATVRTLVSDAVRLQ